MGNPDRTQQSFKSQENLKRDELKLLKNNFEKFQRIR